MKHFIAAIALSMTLAGLASAQSASIAPTMSLAFAGTPENATPVNATPVNATPVKDASPVAANAEKALTDSKHSQRMLMADSMTATTMKLVSDHASGSTELLRSGKMLELSSTMGGVHSALEQHSINVQVTYDATPGWRHSEYPRRIGARLWWDRIGGSPDDKP